MNAMKFLRGMLLDKGLQRWHRGRRVWAVWGAVGRTLIAVRETPFEEPLRDSIAEDERERHFLVWCGK